MSAVVMEPGTGAAPPGARASPAGRAPGGEQVVEPALVLLQLGQTLLRGPGGPAQLRQPAGTGLDQLGELGVLRLPLLASAIELLADVEQVVALLHHAVPELFDVAHQGAVLPAGEVQVLVPAQEVAERFGGEQGLEGVERAPLVDVHQPALQHRAALGEVVLRRMSSALLRSSRPESPRSGARSRPRSSGWTRAGARGCGARR